MTVLRALSVFSSSLSFLSLTRTYSITRSLRRKVCEQEQLFYFDFRLTTKRKVIEQQQIFCFFPARVAIKALALFLVWLLAYSLQSTILRNWFGSIRYQQGVIISCQTGVSGCNSNHAGIIWRKKIWMNVQSRGRPTMIFQRRYQLLEDQKKLILIKRHTHTHTHTHSWTRKFTYS